MATITDLATGLTHWWSMDQSSGVRIDHVGGKNLTVVGATSTPGLGTMGRGGALLFDASANDYAYVTSNGTSSDTLSVGDGEFTIVFFARLDDVATAQQWMLGKSASFGGGNEYDVYWNPPNSITVSWNGDTTTFGISPNPSQGDLIMVTIYKDSSVYGVDVNASGSPAESGVFDELRKNYDFRVGGFASGANNFTGAIDEVAFWNRKLTSDEYGTLYTFLDDNNYLPTYTDVLGIPSTVTASDFANTCAKAITCCDEPITAYSAASATGLLANCPSDVIITFDPPDGAKMVLPGYVILETNSPSGSVKYAEFGESPTSLSPTYSGPVAIEYAGGGITAAVFYDDCPTSSEFSLRYRTTVTENLDMLFTYHCDTPDNVGRWGVFTSGSGTDNHWSLLINASASVTIDRIDLFQLDTNGLWTTGQVWSTTEYIYPYPDNPTKDFQCFPLLVEDTAVPVNSDYDTPDPLITFSGVKVLDLYGEMEYPVSGYFKVEVHMSTGKIIYGLIDTDNCTAGSPPASPCITPAAPVLTPGCASIGVQFAMTVGHSYRIFQRSSCDSLGFVIIASGTVATNPQSVSATGLTEGCVYDFYVSQWDNTSACDYVDSDIASGSLLKQPSGTLTTDVTTIESGGDVVLTWSAKNVTGVTITSDDPTFDLGAVTSSGSNTFSPGPTADNCWNMAATNSCATLNVSTCVTINDAVPSSCPSGLAALYTVDEIAADGTYATFVGSHSCGSVRTSFPAWNGLLPISSTACIWEATGFAVVINDNNRKVRTTSTLTLVASTYWQLAVTCNQNGSDLWVGTKSFGTTPEGAYTRTGGAYTGPATLTIS